jgi:chromatin remodeling complex protein RSC6
VRLNMSNISTGTSTMSSAKPTVAPVKRVAKKESAPAKTVAEQQSTAPAPAPVAVAAAVAAAPAKKEKKAKAEPASASTSPAASSAPVPAKVAAKATAEPAKATAEPAEASAVSAPAANVEPTSTVAEDIESLVAQLQSVRDAAVSGLKALGRLQKRVAKDLKEAGRRRRRNRSVPAEGAAPVAKRPTIFTTPVTLRDSLCAFLGKANGSQMTPADVTKAFSAYIESHKLKDAVKGHTIHPDEAMRKVLSIKADEVLTYRNIQTHLYKLYDLPKKASA